MLFSMASRCEPTEGEAKASGLDVDVCRSKASRRRLLSLKLLLFNREVKAECTETKGLQHGELRKTRTVKSAFRVEQGQGCSSKSVVELVSTLQKHRPGMQSFGYAHTDPRR